MPAPSYKLLQKIWQWKKSNWPPNPLILCKVSLAPTVKAPTYFLPIDVLSSAAKSADIMRIFPKGRDKFLGIKNQGPEITEFLYSLLNQNANYLNLNIMDLLTNSNTKEAHSFVRTLVEEKSNLEAIYYMMLGAPTNS